MSRPIGEPSDRAVGEPSDRAAAAAGTPSPRATMVLLLALLFVSGAAGLVYEVAWTRRLLLLLGSTSTTSAVVLAAFLGGLGLGGAFGGRLADRTQRPIALYGLLELGAAAWALLFPFWLWLLSSPYVALAGGAPAGVRLLLRVVVTALVVVPGAALVGATYPVLVAAAARRGVRVGGAAVLLYAVNTLGAVLGALWSGFFGIFALGVTGASRLAAAGSAAVGLVACLAGARRPAAAPAPPEPPPVPGAAPAAVPWAPLLVAAASGFVALGLEASGVRILVFFVQGFTPSFAAMLGTFLAGLALGSLAVGTPAAARSSVRAAIGLCLLLTGVVALVETALLPHAEEVLRAVRRATEGDPLSAQRVTALYGSALLFLAPAFLLGAAYPLCVRWAAGGGAPVGRAAGRVALFNGLGAVVAPLVVLGLGRLGAQDDHPGGPLLEWGAFAAVSGIVGCALLIAGLGRGRRTLVVGSAAGLALGFLLPLALSTATPLTLVLASHVPHAAPGAPDGPRSVVAVRSDDTTTASVVESATGDRTLYTDDFPAAATGRGYPYMRLLGHLPALSAARPQNAMVIAFGTGTTAGAVAAHADVERLEIAETSRAVLDLASHFRGVNSGVLSDPRVQVRVEDGRNALLLHAPDLDFVTLEPLLPFTPAALPFYTREFYELARDRLRDGGVLCQWLPVHAMPLDLYQALVKTFFETFPDGSLWFFEQSTALLGFKGATRPDAASVETRAAQVERSLRAAGYGFPGVVATGFVASGARTLAAIRAKPAGPLALETVTDDRPFPEAHPSARARLVTSWLPDTLGWLAGLVSSADDMSSAPVLALVPPGMVPAVRQGTAAALRARAEEATADFLLALGDLAAGTERMRAARAAYAVAMRDANLEDRALRRHSTRVERWTLVAAARASFAKSDALLARGDASGAASAAEDALAAAKRAFGIESPDPIGTERPASAAALAEAYLRTGRCGEAQEVISGAQGVWGWDPAIVALSAVVSAHRHGRTPDLAALPPFAQRALRAAPPCRDAGTSGVTAEIAGFRSAWFAGRPAAIRLAGDFLLRRAGLPTVARGEVAQALEAFGSPPNPGADVEREAVLRVLDPARSRFAEFLASDDPERARDAIQAAGHYGIAEIGAKEAAEKGTASPDAARRLDWVGALHDDGSPWAIDRLLALLLDADEGVRAAAARSLIARVPAARLPELAFDAKAPEADRAAARERLRAFFAAK